MTTRLREAQLAFMILTRLPAGKIDGTAPTISSASWAFPVVGTVVGAFSAAAFLLATAFNLPPLAAALLAISVATVATGALHEDGLADTADGFGGGGTLSRKLEIMKDSRIGSYGVLAVVLVLGLTASGMATGGTLTLFVAIGAVSRTLMLLPMTFLKPARQDGLGRSAKMDIDIRLVVAFAISFFLSLVAGGIFIFLLMFLAALAVMALARKQIGGQTGDVLGATQKITECIGWLTAASMTA